MTYEIDYYQRDYTWGEEEIRTLLRDLCDVVRNWSGDSGYRRRPRTAPQYFLGPFVYHEPDAHVLKPGTRIVLTYRATEHWATIDTNGGIVLTATGGTPTAVSTKPEPSPGAPKPAKA